MNAGSSLCGSVHGASPAPARPRAVVARRSAEQRPAEQPATRRHPGQRPRAPDPRARPSSTVSAWSSRVCPSSTAAAPSRSRRRAERGVAGAPGRGLGPAAAGATVDRHDLDRVEAERRAATAAAASRRRRADPACSPWSTTTAPTRTPASARLGGRGRGQRQRVGAPAAARRAPAAPPGARSASAAPDRATAAADERGGRSGRAVTRATRATQRGRVVRSRPRRGRVSGDGPDPVEPVHADLVDDGAHERARRRGTAASWRRGRAAGAAAPSTGAGVAAALRRTAPGSCATVGTTCGPTPSITTSAWPSSSDITRGQPVEHLALLGRRISVDERRRPPSRRRAPRPTRHRLPRSRSASACGSTSTRPGSRAISPTQVLGRSQGTAVNCTRWVSSCRHTHSRKSCGSTSSSRSTCDDVRGDEQQPAGCPAAVNGSYWPSTLRRQEARARRRPRAPVTREPTAATTRRAARCADAARASRRRARRGSPSTLACDPAGAVDHERPARCVAGVAARCARATGADGVPAPARAGRRRRRRASLAA